MTNGNGHHNKPRRLRLWNLIPLGKGAYELEIHSTTDGENHLVDEVEKDVLEHAKTQEEKYDLEQVFKRVKNTD